MATVFRLYQNATLLQNDTLFVYHFATFHFSGTPQFPKACPQITQKALKKTKFTKKLLFFFRLAH